ncbi:MAG: hypothetical protein ACRC7N_17890 [Clostridium sp.]
MKKNKIIFLKCCIALMFLFAGIIQMSITHYTIGCIYLVLFVLNMLLAGMDYKNEGNL